MVYGETGYLTIETEIKIRTITFWVNLLTGRKDKFSYKLYLICLSLFKRKLLIFRWLEYIVKILNDTGFSFIFENQLALDEKYLVLKYFKMIGVGLSNDMSIIFFRYKIYDIQN